VKGQPRDCDGCRERPVATKKHRFCFACEPGGPYVAPPCRRCGTTEDYYSAGLCSGCHQAAPQPARSCLDCFAWGVRRINGGLCKPCLGWRPNNPTTGTCVSCATVRHLNPEGACRLCWRHAVASKQPREPLELELRNRHGQQLFLANIGRVSMAPPVERVPRPPARARYARRFRQLSLFDPPANTWLHRHGYDEPPNLQLAGRLDRTCIDHARRHGWSKTTTDRTRLALRAVLGMTRHSDGPLAASAVIARLTGTGWPTRPVLTVLDDAGLLHDDRTPAIDTWFERQLHDLPATIAAELRVWFDVLRHGSTTPPRSAPRQPVTIRTRCYWALPTIRDWADSGVTSLREITRADVLAALAPTGNERATTAIALRSIFRTLKGRKLIFVNPATRLDAGAPATRQPMTLDVATLRTILDSDNPAQAVVGALIIFHGLSSADLCDLTLTNIRDGYLHLAHRTIPLAAPARTRLAAWLNYRNVRWPNTANAHLFINFRSATTLDPVGKRWLRLTLGLSVRAVREDRILNEAHATGGDVRRLIDLFGLSINAASRYTATVDHPDLGNTDQPRAMA